MDGLKILIADDDVRLLDLLSMLLRKAGYEVLRATDAYHALRLAVEQNPSLLLLDIHMPAGEGFSVQKRLGVIAAASSAPVIYLSGDKSPRIEAESRKSGAFALIHKPFDSEHLLVMVGAALRGADKQAVMAGGNTNACH